MGEKTCDKCVFGYKFERRLPQDITVWGCLDGDWGGYTDPEQPACGGLRFASLKDRIELGQALSDALQRRRASTLPDHLPQEGE